MGGWDNAFLKKAFYFRSEIWEKDWSPLTFIHSFTQQIFTEHQLSFPDSSVGKVSACNSGDPSSIPGSGRSAGEGIGYPLQYSFFFFFFILKLYNIVLVLPNIEMNPPQVYLCSPSWTLLPPHTITTNVFLNPKHLTILWRFVHYSVLYMYICSPWGWKESDTTEWLNWCFVH